MSFEKKEVCPKCRKKMVHIAKNIYTVGKNTHDFSHEMNCRHNS